MDKDIIITYISQTEQAYLVRKPDNALVSIPKNRSTPFSLPLASRSTVFRKANLYLVISAVGLLFSGVTTFLFAPLLVLESEKLLTGPALGQAEKARVLGYRIWGVILFIVSLPLVYIFVLHLLY